MKAPAIPAMVDSDNATITFSLSFTIDPLFATDGCRAAELAGEVRRFLEALVGQREDVNLAALVTFDPWDDRTIIDVV